MAANESERGQVQPLFCFDELAGVGLVRGFYEREIIFFGFIYAEGSNFYSYLSDNKLLENA